MVKMRCKKYVKVVEARLSARLGKCCQKKGIEGCWQCAEFENMHKNLIF
jgi:hypothetical protein